jgi:hypothetical protein
MGHVGQSQVRVRSGHPRRVCAPPSRAALGWCAQPAKCPTQCTLDSEAAAAQAWPSATTGASTSRRSVPFSVLPRARERGPAHRLLCTAALCVPRRPARPPSSQIVFVADPTFGDILNFNVGGAIDLEVPRVSWPSRPWGQERVAAVASCCGASCCGASCCGASCCGASCCGASCCGVSCCGASCCGASCCGASCCGASCCGAGEGCPISAGMCVVGGRKRAAAKLLPDVTPSHAHPLSLRAVRAELLEPASGQGARLEGGIPLAQWGREEAAIHRVHVPLARARDLHHLPTALPQPSIHTAHTAHTA